MSKLGDNPGTGESLTQHPLLLSVRLSVSTTLPTALLLIFGVFLVACVELLL